MGNGGITGSSRPLLTPTTKPTHPSSSIHWILLQLMPSTIGIYQTKNNVHIHVGHGHLVVDLALLSPGGELWYSNMDYPISHNGWFVDPPRVSCVIVLKTATYMWCVKGGACRLHTLRPPHIYGWQLLLETCKTMPHLHHEWGTTSIAELCAYIIKPCCCDDVFMRNQ